MSDICIHYSDNSVHRECYVGKGGAPEIAGPGAMDEGDDTDDV
jgi:hypothetical protein